jgi:hypothetical protein
MSQRRLAAIMFSDIVGYDSLLKEDEKKAFDTRKKNKRIHKRLIKKFNGRWLKEMESGILTSFSSNIDAVMCAVSIQKATTEVEIPVRIGIHLGDVIFEQKDVLGDGVNIASRIHSLSDTHGIVISDTVYKDIKNKEGLNIESLGSQTLKGVDSPVGVYKINYQDYSQLDFTEEPRTRTVRVKHIVGYPYGMLTGWVQKTTPDGRPLFEPNGLPVRSDEYEIIGYGVPDFIGGFENTFTWKNIRLNFLIDFKYGGDIYSGTNVRLTQAGLTKVTLEGREGKDPLQVSGAIQTGVDENGEPVYDDFQYTLTPQEARNYWDQMPLRASDQFTYDASYIKLRQLTLDYIFPRSLLAKTPFYNLAISLVGRDLWIIYKNTPNIDPESTYTNSNSQGLDYFGMPSVRSYGFNLKLGF